MERYERNDYPNGREGWLELERIYYGRGHDERPMQLLALEGGLRDIQCNSAEEASSFIVKLNVIWAERVWGTRREKATSHEESYFVAWNQGRVTEYIREANN